jgi:hypothetical protein
MRTVLYSIYISIYLLNAISHSASAAYLIVMHSCSCVYKKISPWLLVLRTLAIYQKEEEEEEGGAG